MSYIEQDHGAYKWYKRYNDEDGLKGLRDKPRSGRPPFVDEDIMIKIKLELSDSSTGCDFRQVMDIIQKRTGVKYHQRYIFIDYCINGALN